MNENIKFSVLIPTKNRLELLKMAAASVLSQSYSNLELIITDNCSDEDIAAWAAGLNDDRVVYFRQPVPVSVTENWNTANDMATGDYIIMLGDDDALTEEALAVLSKNIILEKSPDVICFCAYTYFQPDVNPKHRKGFIEPVTPLPIPKDKRQVLPLEWRMETVRKCVDFNLAIGYNMQFYCYSKKMVDTLERYGRYYEPPYPDYYTTCMNLVLAEKFIYIPEYLAVIGVTPKSYGYYYHNNKEKDGMTFHNESDFRKFAPPAVINKICSIDEMDTASFITFCTVTEKLGWDFPDIVKYYKAVIRREIELRGAAMGVLAEIVCKEMLPHLTDEMKKELTLYMSSCYESYLLYDLNTVGKEKEFYGCEISLPAIDDVLMNVDSIKKEMPLSSDLYFRDIYSWLERMPQDALYQALNGKSIFLWGAYNHSSYLKQELEKRGFSVDGFIDNNCKSELYDGIKAGTPEEMLGAEGEHLVIIPHENYYDGIVQSLRTYGYIENKDFIYLNFPSAADVSGSYSDIFRNQIFSDESISDVKVKFMGSSNCLQFGKNVKSHGNAEIIVIGNGISVRINDNAELPENCRIIIKRNIDICQNEDLRENMMYEIKTENTVLLKCFVFM